MKKGNEDSKIRLKKQIKWNRISLIRCSIFFLLEAGVNLKENDKEIATRGQAKKGIFKTSLTFKAIYFLCVF